MSHVLNKHKDLPNRIFNACAHGTITNPRVWMTKGTTVIVNICLHCKINVPAYLMSDHNTIKHDALLCDGNTTSFLLQWSAFLCECFIKEMFWLDGYERYTCTLTPSWWSSFSGANRFWFLKATKLIEL